MEDQDRGNNLVEGLAHLPAQLCQLVLGHVEEGILTPAFAPNDVAFRKEGRIGGAVLHELGMRVVQGHHDAQVPLDAGHEELEGGLVLVLGAHFILQLSQERLKFLRSVEARDLTGGNEGVEVLEELVQEELVILDVEARSGSFDTGHAEDDLQVSLELFHAVLPADVWGEELHVEQVGNQLGGLLPAGPGSSGEEEIGARLGERPLREGHQIQDLVNKVDVHGLVFSLVGPQCLVHHCVEVLLADSSQGWQTWDQALVALHDLADEVGVLQLLVESQVALEQAVQHLIKTQFAVSVDEAILEDSRGLVDKGLNQPLSLSDLVPQEVEDEAGDVSRREQVMPVVIYGELLPDVAVEVDQELSQLLGGVCQRTSGERGM